MSSERVPEVLFVCVHDAGRARWRRRCPNVMRPGGWLLARRGAEVRGIRDQIDQRVKSLVGELLAVSG